jgi:putative endopeptidase
MVAAVAALAGCGTKKDAAQSGASSDKGTKKRSTIDVAYMDKSVRPQYDFFQFSNGTWRKENPVPASESRWGSFNELDKANKRILEDVITDAQKANAAKGSSTQILGDFYTSFSDYETRNRLSAEPLKRRLGKVSQITSRDEAAMIVAQSHRAGISSLFSFYIDQDLKDVNTYIPTIGQPALGLPNRDYYFEPAHENVRKEYLDYMSNMFRQAGMPEPEAKAQTVYNLELRLARPMMSPAELRIPETQYNKMSLRDAGKLMPQFMFEKYLALAGSQSFDSIIVAQPAYLKGMNEIVAKMNIEELRSFFQWTIINHYAANLSNEFEQLHFKFYDGVLSGKAQMKPVIERGIENITFSPIAEILGKEFVGKAYSAEAKARVNTMVDNLLASFADRIRGLEWMTDSTKTEALNKLNSIGRKLGFPDEWKNFSSLEIVKTDYAGNLDRIAEFAWKENMAKLHKPVDRKEWGMPPHMVNAYYNPLLNEIAFPAGIMQPPFFDMNAEDAVNYGRIGMVIGHEFTHGFDDMGSKFAADGTFENWWGETDRKLFEERTKTLGETFAAFCPTDNNCVNPDLTMGENIADLGGLTMAYYAYTRTEEFKSGELRDGYTPAQRFFIAYAQLWKINYTDAEMKKRLATDSHSPGMYRVNGPLKNSPEFFQAFDVKPGDPMRNPEKQVARIW